MSELQDQLAVLRRKIARIDRKYAGGPPAPAPIQPTDTRPARYFIDEWMSGEVVETPLGRHFETERLYERHRRHGSMDISNLLELPDDLLVPLSGGEAPPAPVARWAFLDTETTGLAGGSGTYAFLIGVGRVTPEGFRVRQFFMRDHGEEASLLWALDRHLAGFDVLVTYNGKTYDQPLLETRFRMARAKPPFSRLAHLDLLHGARRLWKLRLESCRLVDLENQILGVEREGDLPGEMIPYVYFEYLRTQQAWRVVPIFHHNAVDILTTACLTGIVPSAYSAPHATKFVHGADLIGLARWFLRAEERQQALDLMRRAIGLGLPDDLLFRTMWDVAAIEKRLEHDTAALVVLTDLAASPNPFRVPALEALAKHYEHREKNYAQALEMVRAARALDDSEALRKREARIERRLARPQPRRLL
ncbi:MAG: ribonuclease H-like domain-containing protein [Acidobacteriota bacterium]